MIPRVMNRQTDLENGMNRRVRIARVLEYVLVRPVMGDLVQEMVMYATVCTDPKKASNCPRGPIYTTWTKWSVHRLNRKSMMPDLNEKQKIDGIRRDSNKHWSKIYGNRHTWIFQYIRIGTIIVCDYLSIIYSINPYGKITDIKPTQTCCSFLLET